MLDEDAAFGLTATSSVALHRSPRARRWLDSCVNGSAVERLASLRSSEYWRERRLFLFYRHLYCLLYHYAPSATTVLDVGSALPPFVGCLSWIKRRTILGPKFAGNVAKHGGELFSIGRIQTKYNVSALHADFLAWTPPSWPPLGYGEPQYDLVLCTEVIEHVERPRDFVQKLLALGHVVVLSVPYRWESCEHKCHHKQNKITREKIASWAGRQPLAYDVVEEASGDQRILAVYCRGVGALARSMQPSRASLSLAVTAASSSSRRVETEGSGSMLLNTGTLPASWVHGHDQMQ